MFTVTMEIIAGKLGTLKKGSKFPAYIPNGVSPKQLASWIERGYLVARPAPTKRRARPQPISNDPPTRPPAGQQNETSGNQGTSGGDADQGTPPEGGQADASKDADQAKADQDK